MSVLSEFNLYRSLSSGIKCNTKISNSCPKNFYCSVHTYLIINNCNDYQHLFIWEKSTKCGLNRMMLCPKCPKNFYCSVHTYLTINNSNDIQHLLIWEKLTKYGLSRMMLCLQYSSNTSCNLTLLYFRSILFDH